MSIRVLDAVHLVCKKADVQALYHLAPVGSLSWASQLGFECCTALHNWCIALDYHCCTLVYTFKVDATKMKLLHLFCAWPYAQL